MRQKQFSELGHVALVVRFAQVCPSLRELSQRASEKSQALGFSVAGGTIGKGQNEIAESLKSIGAEWHPATVIYDCA